ncbi:MAG TPA: prepilin-type N-terminal cleavage/methylation domain-containing protein [Pyrinomonadaceae bacterium]
MMNKLTKNGARGVTKGRGERGFTLLQMIIVIAIIAVLSAVALIGVTSARANQRRINSSRVLGSYLEKARVDSVRRRANGTDTPFAFVRLASATTYDVFLDFNGDGVPVLRTFTLENGVSFQDADIGETIAFDWRGRTTGDFLINVFNSTNPNNSDYMTRVAVSGFGDVTINSDVYTPDVDANSSNFNAPTPPPTPTPFPTATPAATATPSSTPSPSPTPSPTATPTATPTPSPTATPNPTPTATPTPTPSATPTPSPTPSGGGSAQCVLTASPTAVSIRKNGLSAGVVSVSVLNATTATPVTATVSNSNEISVSPASSSVAPGGSTNFNLTSRRNNAGFTYQATFRSTNCGTATVTVTVRN